MSDYCQCIEPKLGCEYEGERVCLTCNKDYLKSPEKELKPSYAEVRAGRIQRKLNRQKMRTEFFKNKYEYYHEVIQANEFLTTRFALSSEVRAYQNRLEEAESKIRILENTIRLQERIIKGLDNEKMA